MQRGTICVVRWAWIDGVCEELLMPLVDQGQYREWLGCFSYLGD